MLNSSVPASIGANSGSSSGGLDDTAHIRCCPLTVGLLIRSANQSVIGKVIVSRLVRGTVGVVLPVALL